MPILFCPRVAVAVETRVALTPETAKRLSQLGLECRIESGARAHAGFPDQDYQEAGANILSSRSEGLCSADVVVFVQPLAAESLGDLRPGTVTIGFLDPFRAPENVAALAKGVAEAVGMEFIPRSTIAQKMDALSSQANLAGCAAVLLAALRLDKILPTMMTPAGTIQPSKFLKIDLGETGQTEQGYAKELTPGQVDSSQATARKGNAVSAAGMLLAVVLTLFQKGVVDFHWIAAGLLIGTAIGLILALRVQMTGMPEMVALQRIWRPRQRGRGLGRV